MDPRPRHFNPTPTYGNFGTLGLHTQDQRRRNPQQGILIQNNMADEHNAQDNNGVPAQVPADNSAPSQQWIINPIVGNYNPCTRQGQETFHRKTRGLPEDKKTVLQKEAPSLKKLLKGTETPRRHRYVHYHFI